MGAPVQPDLRGRQRAETHRLIRRTAHELAASHGVAAVSVQAICRAAGVSPRTFFNHFRSKEEALVPHLPDFPQAAVDAFVAGDQPDLVSALESLLGDHLLDACGPAAADEDAVAVQRLVQANPELLPRALAVFGAIEQRLAELVARRTGRSAGDLHCTVAALAATSAMRAAFDVLARIDGDRAGAARRLVLEAFGVLRQLGSPAGARP